MPTPRGSLRIRFNDGGVVTLRHGSEVKIGEYRFDGKQEGCEKALLRPPTFIFDGLESMLPHGGTG